jgi:hypothetical protein
MESDYLKRKAENLIQMRKDGVLYSWTQKNDQRYSGKEVTVYLASKALLNSYTRIVLPKLLPSPKQIAIAVHPGWYI